jgi:DNA transformation protein
MAVNQEYIEYVLDQLAGFGPVESKRMFGGAGLYLEGRVFGLIASDVLYFKTDETNKGDYIAAGSGPFKPFGKDSYEMSYYEVPIDVLEDTDLLKEWASKAFLIARKKKERKKRAAAGVRNKKRS